jgi:hypothetical protein
LHTIKKSQDGCSSILTPIKKKETVTKPNNKGGTPLKEFFMVW